MFASYASTFSFEDVLPSSFYSFTQPKVCVMSHDGQGSAPLIARLLEDTGFRSENVFLMDGGFQSYRQQVDPELPDDA
jgi:hypothetical protein